MHLRKSILVGTGLLLGTFLSSSVAMAQSASSLAPAATDEATSSDVGIAEILVTARKRTERAQDIPVSISVATGQMLENRSVVQLIDIQRQTPSLHIKPSALSGTTTNISMRGQALQDIRLNIDPAVAIYIDGVVLPRAVGSNAADLVDIDRVEVLAGPQGTLYGKNTTGGALAIYTKAPTEQLEGSIKGRYGNFGDYAVSGVINIPVTGSAALRLVGNVSGRDGNGTNFNTGERNGERNSRSFRAALKLNPADGVTVILRGDYARTRLTRDGWKGFQFLNPLTITSDANGNATAVSAPGATLEAALERGGFASSATFNAQPLATRIALLQAADADLRTYSGGNVSDSRTRQVGENVKVWGYSADIGISLTDNLDFKSITGYRAFSRNGTADLDGTPYVILEYPLMQVTDRQISEEAQLAGKFLDGRLNMLIGAYYSDEKGDELILQTGTAVASGVNSTTTQDATAQNRSLGFFTQGTFKFTDTLSTTLGVRYSEDKRYIQARVRNPTNCTSLGVSLASIGGEANCKRDMNASFSRVSYTAGLEFRPNRAIMVYAKTNRGYRSGGLQETAGGATPALATGANQPFEPEIVTDYEIGIKSEWFDRRLRVNLTGYTSKLTNAIRSIAVPIKDSSGVVLGTATFATNAAEATIKGVEFDILAEPVRGMELGVNGAYTDAKLAKYILPSGEDRSGLPLLFTPEWQLGLMGAYTAELPGATWRTQIDYNYTSSQFTSEPGAYAPSQSSVNIRSSIDFSKCDLNIALYGKNITNNRYTLYPVDLRSSFGFIYNGQYSEPATYGIEITKRF